MKRTAAALAMIGLGATAQAAYTWKNLPVGGGGFVSGVVASRQEKGLVYARTDVGGAYRWDAANGKWIPLMDWTPASDPGLMGISSLALDPQDPARVYMVAGISYFNNGKTTFLRSADRGATFDTINVTSKFAVNGNGAGRHMGSRLAVDPNLPNRLIAGSGSSANGAFLTTDRGTTWTRIAGIDNNCAVSFVAFDSSSTAKGSATKVIYVGLARTGSRNLFKSTDAGATWSVVTSLSTQVPQQGTVADDGTLLVTYADQVVLESSTSGSVWKLTRAGAATEISPKGAHNAWSGIAAMPGNSKRLLASSMNFYGTSQCWESNTSCDWGTAAWGEAVLVSEDQGATWSNLVAGLGNPDGKTVKLAVEAGGPSWTQKVGGNLHWTGSVAFDPFDASKAWVTSGQGIFRGTGVNTSTVKWNFASKGIEELVPNDFVALSGGTKLMVAWDYAGVRWQNDSAWPAATFLPGEGSNAALAVASAAPKFVARFGTATTGDILISTDSGKTWTAKSRPNSTAGGTVTFNRDGSVLLFAVGSSVYRSADQGTSWSQISWSGPSSPRFFADPVTSTLFYAYDNSTGKLWTSLDGGKTFANTATLQTWGHYRLAPTPGRTGEFWLAGYNGQSADNWQTKLSRYRIHATNGTATTVRTVGPSQGMTLCRIVGQGKAAPGASHPALYVWGTVNGVDGAYRSDDSGSTWSRINDAKTQFGGPGNGEFLVGDPDIYGRVYLGTFGRGVVYGDVVAIRVNQAPTVSLVLSATKASQTGKVTATATASDADGSIASLVLLVDGATFSTAASGSLSATVGPLALGNHTVQAVATDNEGAKTTGAAQTLSVVWNYALAVSASATNWSSGIKATYTLPTTATSASIQIVNASGTVLKTSSISATSTSKTITSVSSYAAGTYTVRLVVNGATVASRTLAKI